MSTHDPEQPPSGQPQYPGPDQPNPYSQPAQYPTQYPPQYPAQPYGHGYGYPQPYQPYGPQASQKALWSMILGICSIVGATVLFCFYVLGIALGIPAIILGVLASKEIKAANGALTGGGQATAGLVTGIVGIVLNVLFVAFMIVVFATDGFGDPSWNY